MLPIIKNDSFVKKRILLVGVSDFSLDMLVFVYVFAAILLANAAWAC